MTTEIETTGRENKDPFKDKDLVFDIFIPEIMWPVVKFSFYTAPRWALGLGVVGGKNVGGYVADKGKKAGKSSYGFLRNYGKNTARILVGSVIGVSSALCLNYVSNRESNNQVVNVLEKTVDGVEYVTPVQKDGRITSFVLEGDKLVRLDDRYGSNKEAVNGKYEESRNSRTKFYDSIQAQANKIMNEERK